MSQPSQSASHGDDAEHIRLLHIWAENAAAHARALAAHDASWGSQVHPIADGLLILSGVGMYVNRCMGIGIESDLEPEHVDEIVDLSRAAGVDPAVEVTPTTRPATVARLTERGFRHDSDDDVSALVRPIPGPPVDRPSDVTIRRVASAADVRRWQDISAIGWAHVDGDARRVSDAFVVAAHTVDGDGMMIAFDAASLEPLGTASLTIRGGVATLGGMSTDPAHRRRGVQRALIAERLDLAAARGCDLATTTAAAGGASERNLRRHGFTPAFTIQTWTLPAQGPTRS